MEWRGVTIYNVFIGNFFFIAAFGLVITAQWELSIGNGFAYTVFSAFGKLLSAHRKAPKIKSRSFWRFLMNIPNQVFSTQDTALY